jgi:hypothetical protein
MKPLLFATLALALSAIPLGFASADTVYYGTTRQGNHASQSHHRTARAAQPQIACTVVGCVPVAANCHPETGYSMDGIPTGYDVVACR